MWRRVRTQFIAVSALGDPAASKGDSAGAWGIWRVDPGPRGVPLKSYSKPEANGGTAPAQWTFDASDWWLEEHGLIMEKPEFPVPPGRYLVTGGREATAVLTIDEGGGWALANADGSDGAPAVTLHDVTHLPCRSARYTPAEPGAGPAGANPADFPVRPGAEMPPVRGCNKTDYWVVFVVGLPAE